MDNRNPTAPRNAFDFHIGTAPRLENTIFQLPLGSEEERIEADRQRLTAGYPATRDAITSAGLEAATAEAGRLTQVYKPRPHETVIDRLSENDDPDANLTPEERKEQEAARRAEERNLRR